MAQRNRTWIESNGSITGNLTDAPKLIEREGKNPVVTATVAEQNNRRDANGNWTKDTEFHDVTLPGRNDREQRLQQEFLQVGSKGQRVIVQGSTYEDTFIKSDGALGTAKGVVARDVGLSAQWGINLPSPEGPQQSGPNAEQQAPAATPQAPAAQPGPAPQGQAEPVQQPAQPEASQPSQLAQQVYQNMQQPQQPAPGQSGPGIS